MNSYTKDESGSIRGMFANIAERYDLLNQLMTFGRDTSWRRLTVGKLGLKNGDMVLDVGSGTGDLAIEVLRQAPWARVIASDFTWEMIEVGKRRPSTEKIDWLMADAQKQPFESGIFDACVSGFLLRNVTDLDQTLAEQARLLKANGRAVALDTSPLQGNMLKLILDSYFRFVIPLLGRLIAKDQAAYAYLPRSTQRFLQAKKLEARFQGAGFTETSFCKMMFGGIAIHWGQKRESAL